MKKHVSIRIFPLLLAGLFFCSNLIPAWAQGRYILEKAIEDSPSSISYALGETAYQAGLATLSSSLSTNTYSIGSNITRTLSQNPAIWLSQQDPFFYRAGLRSLEDLPKATLFWERDLTRSVSALIKIPFSSGIAATHGLTKQQLQPLYHTLSDIYSLGFLTSQEKASLLLNQFQPFENTPLRPILTSAIARALFKMKAYPELKILADKTPEQTSLWGGINRYAKMHQLPIHLSVGGTQTTSGLALDKNLLTPGGKIAANAFDPSFEATQWYMDQPTNFTSTLSKPIPGNNLYQTSSFAPLQLSNLPAYHTTSTEREITINGETLSSTQLQQKAYTFLTTDGQQFLPQQVRQDASFLQKASLYLASFVIGLEVGPPVMASLGETLHLSLEENILVPVAAFLPYSLGAFFADWLKNKIGRKASLNLGLTLTGGSFLAGATALGLNGHFVPWANTSAHFYSILAALTVASFGGTFIHAAVGPMMSELSKNVSNLIRQKRTAYTELGQAAGLMASYFFPFLATGMLDLDWSAPFMMAFPLVGAAALGINFSKLKNTRPPLLPSQTSSSNNLSLLEKIRTNSYFRLMKEDPSILPLLGGLVLVNGIEMAVNSGFLLLLPSLTSNPSSQYMFGFAQFALPFVLGSFLGSKFLKWFPNHNLTASAMLTTVGALAATFFTSNVYALTAALFTAELGLSSAYTLSFARAAKTPQTQDKLTSLLMASTVACAAVPYVLSNLAQHCIDAGIFSTTQATAVSLIGIPALLSVAAVSLFKKMEGFPKLHLWERFRNWLKSLWKSN